jgi:hypothetical protein
MMTAPRYAILLFALLGSAPSGAQPTADLFTEVLSAAVTSEGLVRYDVVSGHPSMDRLLEMLASAAIPGSSSGRTAFWINAYNAHMLSRMASQPDRATVLGEDDGAFFFKHPVSVAGRLITLDEIEHTILRRASFDPALLALAPDSLDPRIHVALNCAALSCPRLWPEAYFADRIDDQLDAAMRAFVGNPRHLRLEGDLLTVSSLLDWYALDFDSASGGAGSWLISYMDPLDADLAALKARLRGQYAAEWKTNPTIVYEYDWTVNRAAPAH